MSMDDKYFYSMFKFIQGRHWINHKSGGALKACGSNSARVKKDKNPPLENVFEYYLIGGLVTGLTILYSY